MFNESRLKELRAFLTDHQQEAEQNEDTEAVAAFKDLHSIVLSRIIRNQFDHD